MEIRNTTRKLIITAVYLLCTALSAAAQTVITTIPGVSGEVIALDPVLCQIYVANSNLSGTSSSTITVIDGATNTNIATIQAGTPGSIPSPSILAVNPATHKIYFAYASGSAVTVIDGITKASTTIAVGPTILGIAPNPLTNKIYVAHGGTSGVTVIDGVTNSTSTISGIGSALVNPVTNKLYSSTSAGIVVIDGGTNSTVATIAGITGSFDVNTATNKIYVADTDSNEVVVIDGVTNSIIAAIPGLSGGSVAVNPATNRIYVSGNGVTVIDGSANAVITTIPGLSGTLTVDTATNEIYVLTNGNATAIDGATNSTTGIGTAGDLAVDPVTNRLYVLGNGVTVVSGPTSSSAPPVPIQVAISPLPNNQTTSSTPTFSFTATNNLTAAPIDNLLYQVDTLQGLWNSAASQGAGLFSGATAPLQPGTHTLYAYATDGEEVSSALIPLGSSSTPFIRVPLIGNVSSYQFVVQSTGKIPESVSFTGAPSTAAYGSSFTVAATTNAGQPAIITASGACTVTGNLATMVTGIGTCLLTATFPGDDTYLPASATQSTTAAKAATTTTPQNITTLPSVTGEGLTFTATVTSPGGIVNEGYVSFSAPTLVSGATAPVVNGVATLSGIVYPSPGVFPLTASYGGGNDFNPSSGTAAVTVVATAPLIFQPLTPCRLVDTRIPNGPLGGPELAGGSSRFFPLMQSTCPGLFPTLSSTQAYALNITVVPDGPLDYLTVWPTGQQQPFVSTLNSDGRIKANAAIVHIGDAGAITVYASNPTHVIIDVTGIFVYIASAAGGFYPVTPCRIADTRQGGPPLGGPSLSAGETRQFPVLSSNCGIPSSAYAYSLNITAVPHGPLGYLTTWPTAQAQPFVSTLNAPTGAVTANAALVAAGTDGNISFYATDATDVVIDVNGYFAPGNFAGLSLHTVTPCRVLDTRSSSGQFSGTLPVAVAESSCGTPSNAQAFVLNATVVPPGPLTYLTLWPDGQPQPLVSTLNAFDAAITSNMAIVPTSNGLIDAFSSNPTQLILDISGYFAP